MELSIACMAAICSAICSSSSSSVWGLPGNMSPNCCMNWSNAAVVSWPCSRISSSWLSPLNMSFMRCTCSALMSDMAPDIWLK